MMERCGCGRWMKWMLAKREREMMKMEMEVFNNMLP